VNSPERNLQKKTWSREQNLIKEDLRPLLTGIKFSITNDVEEDHIDNAIKRVVSESTRVKRTHDFEGADLQLGKKIKFTNDFTDLSDTTNFSPKFKISDSTTTNATQAQKCHFYPNCTNPTCVFYHPAIPCSKLPNCPFGNACKYVHPPCKFAANCQNPQCIYTHSKASIKSTIALVKDCKNGFACPKLDSGCTFKHPKVACRNPSSCPFKASCHFSHAKPCQFGITCRTIGCTFAHPKKLKQKLIRCSMQTKRILRQFHQH